MDVLIKNMELPKSCYSDEFKYCPFLFFDYDTKSHCELSDEIRCTKTRRPKDCPLVELPPHGRLIDEAHLASLIIADIKRLDDTDEYTDEEKELVSKVYKSCLYKLAITHTVLEAST